MAYINIGNQKYMLTDIKITSPSLKVEKNGSVYYGSLVEVKASVPTLSFSVGSKIYFLASPKGKPTNEISYFEAYSHSSKKKGWCSASIRCIKVYDGVGKEITQSCKFVNVEMGGAHSNSSNWRPDLMMDGRTDTQYWRGGSYKHHVYNNIKLRCYPPANTYVSRVEYYFGSEVNYCTNETYIIYSNGKTESAGSCWWTSNAVFTKNF